MSASQGTSGRQRSKKALTHDRIVEAAARALRSQGFGGAAVADVMARAGLTHGGFYAHFESRDAMLAEALAHAGRESAALMQACVAQADHSALRTIIDAYLSEPQLSRPEAVCPVAALVSEAPRQPAHLRAGCAEHIRALVGVVQAALPASGPRDRAMTIVATMVGALQLARALGANAEGKAMLAASRASLLAAHGVE
jgi:TetR/AcrR family transcriptional repressor of nem operon